MNRTAVVTGSNRGIGRAVAAALREEGWAVVTNGRSALRGPGDLHVRADASTPAGARRLVAAAKRRFGRLDLLVNAVGDFGYTPVSAMKLDAWERLFDSNLRTAWLCCREALPLLRRSRGVILNLGSAGTQAVRANPRAVAYQMAQTALTVFTKSLAQAEARRGVRVNMIHPGFIRTESYTRRELRELTPKVPAGRLGAPEDVARAVLWLASPAASYVTGAVLDVGGGLRL